MTTTPIGNIADMAPPSIRADAEASVLWDGLISRIRQAGGWRDEYVEVLAMLVDSLLSYRHAHKEWVEDGRKSLVTSARRSKYRNPMLDVIKTHESAAVRYLTAFGLTPQVRGAKVAADDISSLLDLLDKPPVGT